MLPLGYDDVVPQGNPPLDSCLLIDFGDLVLTIPTTRCSFEHIRLRIKALAERDLNSFSMVGLLMRDALKSEYALSATSCTYLTISL